MTQPQVNQTLTQAESTTFSTSTSSDASDGVSTTAATSKVKAAETPPVKNKTVATYENTTEVDIDVNATVSVGGGQWRTSDLITLGTNSSIIIFCYKISYIRVHSTFFEESYIPK